jgi:ABC-2 type transport system ATP-binding protein
MTDLMIQAQGLTKHYRKLEAVRGIGLAIHQGEIFGLVGPDGAGKTTTIQMLTGILTPTSGEARVAGVDVVRQADRLGGKIGYMSEGFTLYGTLSVEENLDFFADLYGVQSNLRRERKAQLLQFARLEEARRRRAEHLSGGMKKKLALACTLMYSPQVLFLDEPTTGVDPVSRRDFWKILYDWLQAGEGLTILVSTPYMDEAERFDRVALMHQGRFIATDTPQALKARLNGEMLDLKAEPQATALQVLKSTEGVSHVQVFGERLHLLVPAGNGAEKLSNMEATLAAAGVTLLDRRQSEPSLEDVFVASIPHQSPTGEAAGQSVEGEKQIPEIGNQSPSISPSTGMDTMASIATTGIQSPDDTYAVTVEKLTRRFGDFTAVRDLRLPGS